MDQKNLLKRAQLENYDEREEYIKLKSYKISWSIVSFVIIGLTIFKYIHGNFYIDFVILMGAQLTSAAFYTYKNVPDKKYYLITGISGIITLICGVFALLSQYYNF